MKRFQKAVSIALIVFILFGLGGLQSFAAGVVIFNTGFEGDPASGGTEGVPDYKPATSTTPDLTDYGAIEDIIGEDPTFSSYKNWITDFDNNPNVGNFTLQYETKDNSHQRYARIVDDPTNILFEDSFDDAYAIGDEAHINNDVGDKRNWKERVVGANSSIKIFEDPAPDYSTSDADNTKEYCMQFKHITTTSSTPRLEEVVDASSTKRITVEYKVMTNSRKTYLEVALPLVNPIPSMVPITVNNTTATAGDTTAVTGLSATAWVSVKVDMDFHYNTYDVTINGTPLTTGATLFSTSQSSADLSQVRLRFNTSFLTGYQDAYTLLDDVKVKETDIKFQDDFSSYSTGETPTESTTDKDRYIWSNIIDSADSTITVQEADKRLRFMRVGAGSGSPRAEKKLDISANPRITLSYQVMTQGRTTKIEILNGAYTKVAIEVGTTATACGGSVSGLATNQFIPVELKLDFYNNTYEAFVNGAQLGTRSELFTTPQTNLTDIMVRFTSKYTLTQGQFYYIDNVKIVNTPNKTLKYYAGDVINDSKLRVQTSVTAETPQTAYYYKYRVYFNEAFNSLYGPMDEGYTTSFWYTLSEFFDGACWDSIYDADNPNRVPNYTSRVAFEISEPTGPVTELNPLRFEITHQLANPDDSSFGAVAWQYVSDGVQTGTGNVAVPIGKWVTIELYLKFGNTTTGKFEAYMTPDGGTRTMIFDLAKPTYNYANAPADGFDSVCPIKLYGNRGIFQYMYDNNKDMQIYWDDFLYRSDKP